MPTTPLALGQAKAMTAGALLGALVVTGGVALHLADAQALTTAATSSVAAAPAPTTPQASTAKKATTKRSSGSGSTSGTSSSGFSAPGPVSAAKAPAQSSTNGS